MSDLKNRQVFLRDPVATTIPNDGVTKVVEPKSDNDWDILRYELESFVCEGEYQSGLERILSAFLTNISQPQQQAVWVSGFYGSGKSHLVRVLEYLWRDREFPDGASARSLVNLPTDIKANLTELSRVGRQEGGLWSAAGTLAGAGSVRLALLSLIFRSAGLPEQYPAARLTTWLKQNDLYKAVNVGVEARGRSLETELRHMYVSPTLADSLLEAIPDLASTPTEVHALLGQQYPYVDDISDDELYHAIEDVFYLQSTADGKLPLTLLVFDELQQFIGDHPERTLHVQGIVEACSSRFGSRILFVGTGQSALQANTELSKLQGRFSIQVTLSDFDVEKVVRAVVLRKAPDKIAPVKEMLDTFSGEIDRHLAGTGIGTQPQDTQDRVADYPLLPVRRRLWERLLRVVDTAGTAGQLRTQLRIVHETTKEIGNRPLGTVIPSDAIYRQIKTHMLQNGALLRDLSTLIDDLDDGSEEGKLRSRLCSLIFMTGKLPQDGALGTGVKANADTLADLLVEDITVGSASLRQRVPYALQSLVDDGKLILIGDEYRLQTPESAEWETDYRARLSQILGNEAKTAEVRSQAIRNAVSETLRDLRFSQGTTKTTRNYSLHFGPENPPRETNNVPVRLQDEWSTSVTSVRQEAQQAGIEDATVFVFLPQLEADELKQTIARLEAAKETLSTKPVPSTGGGIEARSAMDTRGQVEQQRLSSLVDNIVKNARVYQGGGNEVTAESFPQSFREATEAGITRMFPKFPDADQTGWDTVIRRASEGGTDLLSVLGYTGDVDSHPVCQEVRTLVGSSGRKGAEVRRHFTSSPYGWPQDTVDGALLALLAGGFIRATRNGQTVTANGMNRQQIGVTDFAREGVTISATQRLAVRRVGTAIGLPLKGGEEAEGVPSILMRIKERAHAAGGEPPLPESPDHTLVTGLQELFGNQQVAEVADKADELINHYLSCSAAADTAEDRLRTWILLESFFKQVGDLTEASQLKSQMEAIRSDRTILNNPDPIPPLLNQITALLRKAVSEIHELMVTERDREVAELEASENWSKLQPEERERILVSNGLGPIPELCIGTDQELIDCLEDTAIKGWEERLLALKARVDRARGEAARQVAPKAVTVRPSPATLNSREDVEAYVRELRDQLLAQVDEHPVIIP